MTQIITLPYKFEPRSYQVPFLKKWDEGCKRLILVGHRRLGKDKMVFANLPKKMMERVGTYFYFLPTYNQARKVIWNGSDSSGFRFLDHFPKEIVKKKIEDDMIIELTNGSILQLVGADNIDRIVGTNPIGIVLSEYSIMKPEVWNFLSPILRENGGWATFVYTPRGQNHGYKLMKDAQKLPDWHVEILKVSDTKALTELQILEAKATMPNALYMQEYECDFTENASAVFKDLHKRTYPAEQWVHNDMGLYQLGVDLAKMNDYTVITPIDLNTFRVGPQDSFNQIDYTLQKTKIGEAYYYYNKPLVRMDATGVGSPVIDDLLNKGINIDGFTFTYNSRNELLTNLQILLEQDKIKIPDDPELLAELEAAAWDTTAQGRTRITVPDDKHDDRMMSLALAVWQLPFKPITYKSMMQAMKPVGGVEPFYEGMF